MPMKVTVAKTAGFCMGVRRAVDMVLDASNASEGPIYTYGPLIHNPQVLEILREKGISVMDTIPEKGEGTVLIRAHGIPPAEEDALNQAGFTVINATCPRVVKVQSIIRKHARAGYAVIIVGDSHHPEVKGLLGYAEGKGVTVSATQKLDTLPAFENAVIVAQTTQDTVFFKKVKQWAETRHPHYKIFDTICHSTENRQRETRRIADENDAVIILGGKKSGNTKRLAQIAAERDKPSAHIEDISELDFSILSDAKSVAVTAGASTPNWIITKACRDIEKTLQKKKPVMHRLFKIRDLLIHTSLLLSVGAGCLTYACSKLQHFEYTFVLSLISFFYILSMQTLNNLLTIKSDKFNNPERAVLYKHHYRSFLALTLFSGAAGLFLAYKTGLLCFILLLVMSLLGLSYNLKVIPSFIGGKAVRRIKDIHGSKTILIAAAWGTVTAILPAVSNTGPVLPAAAAFVFSTGLVFSRTALFDVLDVQGDRITKKETLPVLIGEKRSIGMIKRVLSFIILALFLSTVFKVTPFTGLFLALMPCLMIYLTTAIGRGDIIPRMQLVFLVESHFILAGIIAAMMP